jgi:hypothetical protein
MEGTGMHSSVETASWFSQRNLGAGPTPHLSLELPREVEIYLLVTFARRPLDLPVEIRVYLAARFFCNGIENQTIH